MKRLLLVEDDAIIALDEETALSGLGYDVACVRNAEKALEYLRGNRGSVDLVLMDIDLGEGMDGIGAAHELRKSCDAHIIFLSSKPRAEVASRARGLSSWTFFSKGSGVGALEKSIRAMLQA